MTQVQDRFEIPGEFGIIEEVIEFTVSQLINLFGQGKKVRGKSRFAVVDLKTDTIIKHISARKALLLTQRRRRRRPVVKKEVHIIRDGQDIVIGP